MAAQVRHSVDAEESKFKINRQVAALSRGSPGVSSAFLSEVMPSYSDRTFCNCWSEIIQTSCSFSYLVNSVKSVNESHSLIAVCVSCVCNFSKVAEHLKLKDTDLDLRSAVILDYYVAALWWCREQSYTAEQTSAFFTVIDTLYHSLGSHLFAI